MAGSHALEHEHHVWHQAVCGGRASEHVLHHRLEGKVLMRQRAQESATSAGQSFGEGGITREAQAKGHLLDEAADQPLQLGSVAIGDHGGQKEVVLSGVALNQDTEGRQHRHVHGCPLATGECP
ncbi:MAG: hypothetical protein M3O70_09125 [Actinomycetota bacterium]|nr:hypothetical protein [Actinomycetota bacterium]